MEWIEEPNPTQTLVGNNPSATWKLGTILHQTSPRIMAWIALTVMSSLLRLHRFERCGW